MAKCDKMTKLIVVDRLNNAQASMRTYVGFVYNSRCEVLRAA